MNELIMKRGVVLKHSVQIWIPVHDNWLFESEYDDIMDWLHENVSDVNWGWRSARDSTSGNAEFIFKNLDDAILFKLAWH
jgi:hypothetical protein